jgi:hypothetical protein
MIKAYAEPDRHFVEVKLGTEETSDPLLVFSEIYSILEDVVKQINHQVGDEIPLSAFCQAIADAAKYEEIYQSTDNVPVDNILNFEDYVKTHKE